MEKRTGLAVLILALLTAFASAQNAKSAQPVLNVSSMDKNVDPCVDFFGYSCGGWIKKNPIPPDQTSWHIYSKLEDDNKLVLRDILESAAKADPERDATKQKIGDYYAACMDESAIEKAGIAPLRLELERIGNLKSKEELASLVVSMQPAKENYLRQETVLFDFGSLQDFKDSTQVIAAADQGGLGLPDRDYYLKDDEKSQELRKAYMAHVQKMFELLGDKPDAAAVEAQAVMKIESALAKGSLTRVERRDPTKLYHKLSREELQRLSPSFHWSEYFTRVGLDSLQSLNVVTPDFFKALNAQLEQEDLTSWKAYLRWHLVHANAPFLSSAFVDADFDFFEKTLQGTEQLEPRWKRCVSAVDNQIGEALGQAYVERNFSPEAKQRALKIVKQIEAAMQQDITGLPWMSATTKQHALEKLHAIANKIGYPDKWRDYSALKIDRNDELGNVLQGREFEFHRQLAKIGKPVDRGEWQMTPPTVNAYYDPQMNDINFPAGTLQPPLFSAESDDAPNYGNTGGTIGHELTHGFDDEGRQFDAQGNLRDWWTPEDAKEFEQRASCISNQYSQYVIVDDIKINGKLTLGEDVADLGGLMLAYMAWKDETKNQKLEPLEGFTPEQRFFIAYGQSWCGSTRDETKRLRATVDPHSPDKYRTNGVVSNMPEFQEAFHCKAGSPMVRENRCRVW
ncbi:MAG: M13 family peptidase [Acidobacteria bacterium]|nr:MAG: M13 family peptidase [Acidobacteriota bacterium]